eukprot:5856260-Amphidinium_carterae.1
MPSSPHLEALVLSSRTVLCYRAFCYCWIHWPSKRRTHFDSRISSCTLSAVRSAQRVRQYEACGISAHDENCFVWSSDVHWIMARWGNNIGKYLDCNGPRRSCKNCQGLGPWECWPARCDNDSNESILVQQQNGNVRWHHSSTELSSVAILLTPGNTSEVLPFSTHPTTTIGKFSVLSYERNCPVEI